MKNRYRILLPLLAALLTGALAQAQAPMDMTRNGMRDIHGTARAQGMSNAVGALGADPTAVSINPAGIGLYRSSEVSLGFNFGQVKTSTNWMDKEGADMSKWVGNLDHLSIIFPIYQSLSSDIRLVMGASMSSLYDYDRDYEMRMVDMKHGLAEYMANYATRNSGSFMGNIAAGADFIEKVDGTSAYRPGNYIAFDPTVDKDHKYLKGNIGFLAPTDGRLNVSEKGSRKSYDFTIGGSWADRIYFGAALRSTSMSYSRSSMYREDYFYSHKPDFPSEPDLTYYNELGNGLSVAGGTVGANLGIMAAIGDYGRIGLSYNTPSFGRFNEVFYTTTANYNSNALGKDGVTPDPLYETKTDDMTNSYSVMLPGDLTASAMAFLGGYGMVTYDFNWRDLGSARFQGSDFTDVNSFLKEDYGSQMTHRVGVEVRPISWLYLRAGYSYTDGGIKAEGLHPREGNTLTYNYVPAGTITDIALRDSYQSITAGLGCKLFGSTTLDLAYVRGKATERVYPFPAAEGIPEGDKTTERPTVNPVGASMSTVTDRLVASLTFRF